MRKIVRFITCLICLSLVAIFIAFAGLCAWAITGPRDVTQYAEYIEKSINGTMTNNHLKIGKTFVEWGGLDELLSIKANNVDVYVNGSNQKLVALPQVILKYGITSLVTGFLIPSELKLVEPRIDLTNVMHKGEGGGLSLADFNLERLDKVSVTQAVLIAPDKSEWNLPSATLWYNDGGILINASINRTNQEAIELSVRTDIQQKDSLVKASFTNFNTDTLAYYLPEIAPVHVRMNGRGSFTANAKGKVATFNIDNFGGTYDDASVFKNKLDVKTGSVSGSYDIGRKILDIQKLNVNFADNFHVGGKARIVNFKAFDIALSLANLRTVNIKNYWPSMVAPNGLRWVAENLSGGEVSDGALVLKIKPEDLEKPKLPREAVSLKFNFNGVSSTYIPGFAPVTNGAGKGELDGDAFHVHVAEASLNNSKITNTGVNLNALGSNNENLTLDGHIQGPVEDAAEFYIRLSKGQKLFAAKSDISGNAATDVTVKLPLLDTLKMDDVAYTIKAQSNDGAIKNFYGLFGVERLKMSLNADNNSYSAKGECLASYATEDKKFALNNAPLGFDISGKNRQMRIAVASNITNSTLEFAPLEIKKPAGEPGKLIAEILDDGVNNPVLNQFGIDSKSIYATARGSLRRDYANIALIDVTSLKFGKTDMAARMTMTPYLTAEFKGKYFDAAPVIRFLKKDRAEDNDETKFKIFLRADEVGMLNNRSLRDAQVTLQCQKNCDIISINTNELNFNQSGGKLRVKTANAGNILDAFDVYSNMVGGKLDIDATVNNSDYNGKIAITDFAIVKAKVLARMLTIGSLTGIADIVSGKGITFKKLSGDVHMDKHTVNVTEFRMVGAAIGITAKGALDRDKYTADFTGNIIPAYTANTLLGNIPLIGPAIIGDEGVFALAYHLTGNVDDPKMSVNPLSILAPGFLKNVFQ